MNKRTRKKFNRRNCRYCHNYKSLYWNPSWRVNAIREIYVEGDASISVTSNLYGDGKDEDERIHETVNFGIDFCPKCGRNLRKNKI